MADCDPGEARGRSRRNGPLAWEARLRHRGGPARRKRRLGSGAGDGRPSGVVGTRLGRNRSRRNLTHTRTTKMRRVSRAAPGGMGLASSLQPIAAPIRGQGGGVAVAAVAAGRGPASHTWAPDSLTCMCLPPASFTFRRCCLALVCLVFLNPHPRASSACSQSPLFAREPPGSLYMAAEHLLGD